MLKKKKKESVPTERTETIRHELASFIMRERNSRSLQPELTHPSSLHPPSRSEALTAKELSPLVGISEKEVYPHLEHIRLSFGKRFVVSPAVCRRCGFEFKERRRLTRPSRCPKCKGESIEEAAFSII